MEVNEIERKLIELIEENVRIEIFQEDIKDILKKKECDLMDDFGIDSLLMVKLIVDVETTFGFEFELDFLDIEKLRNYRSLFHYIEKHVK